MSNQGKVQDQIGIDQLQPSRRIFLTGVAGASVVAAYAAPALAQSPQGQDYPPPSGIAKRGMFDSRFPIAYEASVPAAMTLLTQYFAALARRDVGAMARTLHFPYATYEGVEPTVYQTAQEYIAKPVGSIDPSGKGESEIKPGYYDMLDQIELHTFNPVNVGLSLVFTRYEPDGNKLGQYQTIHAVTNNAGKWGIQLSSTIFTPEGQRGTTYTDAVEANLRQSRDWMLGYSVRDPKILASRERIKGRRTAGIRGPGAVSFLESSRDGRPMEPYRTNIASRLVISEPGAPITPSDFYFGIFYDTAGGGVGDYGYTQILPNERVLHATVDKAHTFGGYIRYTPDNRLISETRSLGIMTYDAVEKRWAGGGGLGQSMYHDYTNDRRD
jgi:hypothetical protein